MEINSSPDRLDLKDTHAYRASELGVPLVINNDAHHHTHLAQIRYGVAVARRARCEARHILNTRPAGQFLGFIHTPKPQRIKVLDAYLGAQHTVPLPSRPVGAAAAQERNP